MERGKGAFEGLRDAFSEEVLFFREFGHDAIKACRVSPDAFIQMAIGLAYFLVHGEHATTYETGQTRMYGLGRTETVRASTRERAELIEALAGGGAPKATVAEALSRAMKKHLSLLKSACTGKGIDRHLLGLRMAITSLGAPVPDLFTSSAYIKSSTWTISSSNTNPAPFPRIGGFGPVVADGYGICYSTLPSMIMVSLSSWRTSGKTSSGAIRSALVTAFRMIGDVVGVGAGVSKL